MTLTKEDMIFLFERNIIDGLEKVYPAREAYCMCDKLIDLFKNPNGFNNLEIEPEIKRLYQSMIYYYDDIMCGKCDNMCFQDFYYHLCYISYEIMSVFHVDMYCDRVLDPNIDYSENNYIAFGNLKGLKNFVMDASNIYDHNYIKREVNKLQYKDFLKTAYWQGIRKYKLDKANNKCALCNSKKRLNVHHKTYDRHGTEHLPEVADEDLIVLCQDCHAKFHDKLAS